MDHPAGYSRTQIILHWITAIAILITFLTHDAMIAAVAAARDSGTAPFPTLHTAAGMVAFFAILIRLWLRRRRGAPAPQGAAFNQMAAEWGHRLLYALLVIVPILGALNWFGGLQALEPLHKYAGRGLILLSLGHALMAIFHQVVKKDGTLMRMVRADG